MVPLLETVLPFLFLLPAPQDAAPDFERLHLSSVFTCEGASFADLDRDGHGDLIAGPSWWSGPDYTERHAIYPGREFDPGGYSDNFFAFPRDLDGDGWLDVLFVGFPGQSARWYRNPGEDVATTDAHWAEHLAFETVDNESPTYADLTGDGVPELVFHTGGRLGWATPDPADPTAPWTFHPLSPDLGLQRFTHGLGVSDVDGDGRADVLEKSGWWRQPASLDGDPVWERHAFEFTPRGGAQMLVTDVDGDGDADVVTSLWAHGFGLAWFEQREGADGGIDFARHLMLSENGEERIGGVQFAELHALALADVNADGLEDVVTGKRWWSHGAAGDPEADPKPVVYWFELVRDAGGARYVPHLVDDGSGVGTQVVAGDVDGDGRVDVVIGNKRGAFLLRQLAPGAEPEDREAPATPAERTADDPGVPPTGDDGQALLLDFESGTLAGWTAIGDAFEGQPVRGDAPAARGREPSEHQGECWIGGYEIHGDGRTGELRSDPFTLTLPYASFLIGGGGLEETGVELRRAGDDSVIQRCSGAYSETMKRVAFDVSQHEGERVYVALVDDATGGWGHVNFDDFRLHAEPQESAILPLDEVEHAGLAPEEAARAMTVPDGFQVEVVAAEPDLHQPVALAIDSRGRPWVAEAFGYPARQPEGEGKDDIVVFSDEDGDGRHETRTVFASGLNLVSGLEVGFGGVFVGAAPELLFIPDADGDLVPDGEPEVLLDGWGYEDTHETLNAFFWGPDGWLYGCHGVFTHSRVGKPGTPDEEREPLNAGVWRFHPTRREFEVFAWGTSNPWGVVFDARGQAFVTACVIPHLYHLAQGGRYERQAGSHFNAHVYADIPTIADHRHYLGDTPHGGNLRSNQAGGGHAHCGALLYQGDSFPEQYRGTILMNNIHGNRVNNDTFERIGSGFVGRHAEDFLLANDRWFRGIALRTAPDGSVFLIDWYDEQACHDTTPERWDRTNGRLYRVSYGAPRDVPCDLPELSSAALADLALHPNDWFARRARIELQSRGPDAAVHARLDARLAEPRDEPQTLRLVWALHATGGLSAEKRLALLASPHEAVRAWAVQLACEERAPAEGELAAFARLAAEDPSPLVRLYLASALQRLAPDAAWPIAEALAHHGEDADDPNVPLILWYGVEPLVTHDPERALALSRVTPLDQLARFIVRRAANEPDCQPLLTRALVAERDRERRAWMLTELGTALEDEVGLPMPDGWPELYAELARDPDQELREHALWIAAAFGDAAAFPSLREIAADSDGEEERRSRALDALVRGRDKASVPVIAALLDDDDLRGHALRALASFDDAGTPDAILARWDSLGDDERRDALHTLAARAPYARALLVAVEDGRVSRDTVSAFVLRQLRALGDAEVDELLAREWPVLRDTSEDAQARVAAYRAKLDEETLAAADLPHGRALFAKTCAQCHTLFGVGDDLGPDLTGSNRADLDYLLTTVLDPNAVIGRDYQATIAWMLDGRIVSGIETARSATAVTLRSENETVVVGLDEVEELELSELSTMPEGLLDPLDDDEVRDLVAYLASPVQVPRLATPADTDRFFDGETLAGWHGADIWSVEDGEIVGRTDGLERNEFLKSELELADFRLSFEVKLEGGAGNSGVQFRSRELEDGDVAGYQADIGEGWWGKLYEEHGRAVLSDAAGDPIADGEWHRYTIEAIGSHVRLTLDDVVRVDLDDPEGERRGITALQVHSGGPTEVRFRSFALEIVTQGS